MMTEPEAIGLELLSIRCTEKRLKRLTKQITEMCDSGRKEGRGFVELIEQWGTLQKHLGAHKCALQRHGFTYIEDGMVMSNRE